MRKLILASSLLLASFAANAQYAEIKQGPYVGAGFGTSKISVDDYGSDNFSTYMVTAGYHFAQPWAVEVAYIDPKTSYLLRSGSDYISYDTSAVAAQVVGHLPLGGPWTLQGSLGALWWHQKVNVRAGATFVSDKQDDVDIVFGAGLGLAIQRIWVRGGYDRAETHDGSVGTWSLRATYHF